MTKEFTPFCPVLFRFTFDTVVARIGPKYVHFGHPTGENTHTILLRQTAKQSPCVSTTSSKDYVPIAQRG